MEIKIQGLSKAVQAELEAYRRDVVIELNEAARAAAEELKSTTKKTAPKRTGNYRKHISVKKQSVNKSGDVEYLWYVKDPDHRLTHLLNDGHMTRGGTFVDGSHFLDKAVETVEESYQEAVEKCLKK